MKPRNPHTDVFRVIRRAIKILKKDGWVKGHLRSWFKDKAGFTDKTKLEGYCLLGAISKAAAEISKDVTYDPYQYTPQPRGTNPEVAYMCDLFEGPRKDLQRDTIELVAKTLGWVPDTSPGVFFCEACEEEHDEDPNRSEHEDSEESLFAFNDTGNRTKNEVLNLLRNTLPPTTRSKSA